MPEHPKTGMLAAELGIAIYAAVGILECLWHWTARYARRGDVGRWPDEQIARGIGWPAERAGELTAALVKCGWVDVHPEHRLVVHDWHVHADEAVRKALQRAGERFVTAEEAAPQLPRTQGGEEPPLNPPVNGGKAAASAPHSTNGNDIRAGAVDTVGTMSGRCRDIVGTMSGQCRQNGSLPLPLPLPLNDNGRSGKVESEGGVGGETETAGGGVENGSPPPTSSDQDDADAAAKKREAEEMALRPDGSDRPHTGMCGDLPRSAGGKTICVFAALNARGRATVWPFREGDLALLKKQFPGVDVEFHVDDLRRRIEMGGQPRTSCRGMRRRIVNWLSNVRKWGKERSRQDACAPKRGGERAYRPTGAQTEEGTVWGEGPEVKKATAALRGIWERARERVRAEVPEEDWEAYLEDMGLAGSSNGSVVLAVGTGQRRDHVVKRYGGLIEESLSAAAGRHVGLKVVVALSPDPPDPQPLSPDPQPLSPHPQPLSPHPQPLSPHPQPLSQGGRGENGSGAGEAGG